MRDGPAEEPATVLAAFDRDGTFALAYSPYGAGFTLELAGALAPGPRRAQWIDPRTGHAIGLARELSGDVVRFDPPFEPARGNDWVLRIEVDEP